MPHHAVRVQAANAGEAALQARSGGRIGRVPSASAAAGRLWLPVAVLRSLRPMPAAVLSMPIGLRGTAGVPVLRGLLLMPRQNQAPWHQAPGERLRGAPGGRYRGAQPPAWRWGDRYRRKLMVRRHSPVCVDLHPLRAAVTGRAPASPDVAAQDPLWHGGWLSPALKAASGARSGIFFRVFGT